MRRHASNPRRRSPYVENGFARRTDPKESYVWTLVAIIGLPLILALAGAGVLVDSMGPDELSSMGVDRRS